MGDWQSIVNTKQEQVEALVPPAWRLPDSILSSLKQPLEENPTNLIQLDIPRRSGILSGNELDITETYSVRQLLEALASGNLSSEEVVTAYCKRSAIAHELTRCLTETYYSRAIERAKSLDKLRAESGQLAGPLHGLPVSIKDQFDVEGSDSSIGYVSFLNKPKTTSAVLVKLLEQLGAVIYVKTNLPQTMMCAESINHIFGRVLNPHNTALCAGGSSGGEGALVAMRGSPLGVGTDIGGSIRVPALCCGLYGFKPSANRVPTGGWTEPGLEGFLPIVPSAGPLGHSVDALEIFMSTMLDARPAIHDTLALDIPWRRLQVSQQTAKLRIGVLPEDPMYPLHPSEKYILADAVQQLQAQGHVMIPLPAPSCHIADASEVCWSIFGLEPETVPKHLAASGEPLISPLARGNVRPANLGAFTWVPDISSMNLAHQMSTLNQKRFVIEDDWRKLWHSNQLDVVIGTGAQGTAVKHETFGWVPYSCIQNLLNFPACVIPVGCASKTLHPEKVLLSEKLNGPDYIPDEVDGAPCHVQVFTTNLRDEECLLYARIIDACLNGPRSTNP